MVYHSFAMDEQHPKYLLISQVADRLNFTGTQKHRSAWRALRRIGVPLYHQIGRRHLVREDDLNEVLLTGDCVQGKARYAMELLQHHAKKR